MKLQSYLRLLRPARSLLQTAFFAAAISRFSLVFFHQGAKNANASAIVLIGPLMLGGCLAAAAHAAMHRPFFPLLPGARAELRRFSAIGLVLIAGVVSAVAVIPFDLPFVAAAGVAAALAGYSFLNERTPGWLPVAFAPLAVIVPACAGILATMRAQPIACGVIGGALAVLCLARGFARSRMRARSRTCYNSAGPGVFVFFQPSASQRFTLEQRQDRSRRSARVVRVAGSVPRNDGSLWSWMRLTWYSTNRGIRYPWSQCLLVCFFVLEAAAFALFGLAHDHFGWSDYWRALAGTLAPNPYASLPPRSVTFAGAILAAEGVFLASLALTVAPPRLAYPLSRRRLSHVVFGASLVQIGVAVVGLGIGFMLLSVVGQWCSGEWLPGLGLRYQLLLLAGVGPLLPLVSLLRTLPAGLDRIVATVIGCGAMVAIAATRPFWQSYVATPVGMAAVGAVAAITSWLLYAGLQRHYRRCDLIQEVRGVNPCVSSLAGA